LLVDDGKFEGVGLLDEPEQEATINEINNTACIFFFIAWL
jgi:hypothetical protein